MRQVPSYQGFSAIYDTLMEEAPYEEWLKFVLRNIESVPTKSKNILDLGCGTGRLACMLAKSGYRMTGVDISAEMLSMAAERMSEEKLTPFPLIQQDMRELELNEQFGVTYSLCDSLNYLLEEEDVRQTFLHVTKHLEEGGLFLFDVHSPYKITHTYSLGPIVDEDEAISYIWIPEVNEQTLCVDHHIHFFVQQEDDLYRRISELHQQRAYSIQQLSDWLHEASLDIISITADFTEQAPTDTSERLFFVTRKRS